VFTFASFALPFFFTILPPLPYAAESRVSMVYREGVMQYLCQFAGVVDKMRSR